MKFTKERNKDTSDFSQQNCLDKKIQTIKTYRQPEAKPKS